MTDVDIFSDLGDDDQDPRAGIDLSRIMIGIVLIGIGGLWLLASLDIVDLSWRAVMAGALVLIGIALIIGSTQASHSGLVTSGIVLTVILGLASTASGVLEVPFTGGIGDSTYAPASMVDIDTPYRLAIGDLTVDLSAVDFSAGITEIEASVGIGQLTVRLPDGVAIEVTGSVGAGRLVVDGVEYSGTGVDEIFTDSGFAEAGRRLRLTVRVGLGDVEVRR